MDRVGRWKNENGAGNRAVFVRTIAGWRRALFYESLQSFFKSGRAKQRMRRRRLH
jgi:hypothetical protein